MNNIISSKEYLRSIIPSLSVGLLSADFLNLGQAIISLEQANVKLLHIDVMDGSYCPLLTIGPPVIKQIKTKMLKDVHLMINDPLATIDQYIEAGSDIITIQYESSLHPHRALQAIRELNPAVLRGISINPGTTVELIEPLLEEIDIILILAVNPGWGGQKFLPSINKKIQKIRQIIKASGKEIFLSIDGGVTMENIKDVSAFKPDIIVSGSAVFKGNSIQENIDTMILNLK